MTSFHPALAGRCLLAFVLAGGFAFSSHDRGLAVRELGQLVELLCYPISAALFFVPGIALSRILIRRNEDGSDAGWILALSCLTGFLAFWAYLLGPAAGKTFSFLVYGASLAWLIRLRAQGIRAFLSPACIQLLLPQFLIGALFLGLFHLVHHEGDPSYWIHRHFFTGVFPGDNLLPRFLADRLYSGQDPRLLMAEWHSSDRPPLQAGIVLLQYPVLGKVLFTFDAVYHSLTVFLQASWVTGLLLLCRSAKVPRQSTHLILALCACLGFVYFNTVYVWPKMLAAGLALASWAWLLRWKESGDRSSLAGAALSFALSMMSHSATVFAFPILLLTGLQGFRKHRNPRLARDLGAAMAPAFLILAAWAGYQRFYDPPGDRLVKWFLGGVMDPDPRPAAALIVDSYRKLSFSQLLHLKWSNLSFLFGTGPLLRRDPEGWRVGEFFHLFRALGLLNLGWLFLWRKGSPGIFRHAIGGALLSIAFWCILVFGPGWTSNQSSAYAMVLTLAFALSGAIASASRALGAMILLLQLAQLTYVWVLTVPASRSILDGAPINPFMVALISVSAWSLWNWRGADLTERVA